MKRRSTKVALSIFAIVIASILTTEYTSTAEGRNNGAPAGNTGSPADNSTCNKSCHGRTNASSNIGASITSNIPAEGYTPGVVYTITGTISNSGSEFGFSMSPQNNSGTQLGTWTNTSTNTILNGTNNKYVTQTSAGSIVKTWSIDWTAPTAGTGAVTFYGSFMISNNNTDDDSGDQVQKTTLVVQEKATCTAPTITGTTGAARCDAGSVTLNATASAGTINWYAASTGGTSLGTGTSFTTPSISSNTTYYVDATNSGCTTATRTAVTATVTTTPSITGTTDASRCGTGSVNLSATASGGTINWYAASTGGTSLGTGNSFPTPSISSTTTYYVDATNGACTSASRTAVTATVNSEPIISNVVTDSSCGSGTVNLSATTSAGNIKWYDASTGGNLLNTGNAYSPTISSSTTYYLEADNGTCTSASRTAITAVVNNLPTASIGNNTTVCTGTSGVISVNLTGTAPWSFTYGKSAVNTPVSGINASTYTTSVSSGTYTLATVSDATGCTGNVSGTATVSEFTPLTVSSSTITCDGTNSNYTVEFDITGGDPLTYSVTGSGTLTGSRFTANAVVSGNSYSFVVDDNNHCAPITISGTKNCNCAAAGTISGGGTVCSGNSVTVSVELTGSAPWDIVYSLNGTKQPKVSGINSSPYTFTTTTTGTYTLDSVYDSNCQGSPSGSAVVTQNLPTATLSGGGTICSGQTANLDIAFTGNGPWAFSYSDGTSTLTGNSNNANTSIAKSTAGNYSLVSVSDVNSCVGTPSGSATITVNNTPTITVDASPSATICAGTNVSLTASGAASYSWSSGQSVSSITVSPTTQTSYTVTGTSGSCSSSTVQTIYVNQLPSVIATASPSNTVCSGSSVTLSGSGTATNYTWSGGVVNAQAFVPTNNASYTVTGVDANNCSSSDVIDIAITTCGGGSVASVSISSNSNTICEGGVATFTATPTNGGSSPSYIWKVNSNYAGTNSPVFTTTGLSLKDGDVVSVTMTSNLSGVTGSPATSNTKTIKVKPTPPKPTVTRVDPGIQLMSSSTTGNVWYFNNMKFIPQVTDQYYTLTETSLTGNYSVKVTIDGCSSEMSDPLEIINTGVEEAENQVGVNVYPNPNNGTFSISIIQQSDMVKSLIVKDVLGQTVYTESLLGQSNNTTQSITIPTGAGVYSIVIQTTKGDIVKKIVVY